VSARARLIAAVLPLVVAASGAGPAESVPPPNAGCVAFTTGAPGTPAFCGYTSIGVRTRYVVASVAGWDISYDGVVVVSEGGYRTRYSSTSAHAGEINPPAGVRVHLSIHHDGAQDGFIAAWGVEGTPEGPVVATIVGAAGAYLYVPGETSSGQFATRFEVPYGAPVTFLNLTDAPQSLTEFFPTCATCTPRFDSGLVAPGATATVTGVAEWPHRTRLFHSTTNPGVQGIAYLG